MAKPNKTKVSHKSNKHPNAFNRFIAKGSLTGLAAFVIVFGGIGAYFIATSHADSINDNYEATWEAEYTGIQQPKRHDQTPIEHTGGTRVAGAWRSDPAGNNNHYALWGPYTTENPNICGTGCWNPRKTVRFYMSSVNGGISKVRIEVHSNRAETANRQMHTNGFVPTISKVVSVSGHQAYNLELDLRQMAVCVISEGGSYGYYNCGSSTAVVKDLEFRVMVISGRVDIDKVQLWH
ncbi:MAG TPA: hypothetical protein VLF39_02225 [Candidatus Saccharimonadales bacterium]|nr:hypothetical protein [Candidatus Saccharimonadales bacterium]